MHYYLQNKNKENHSFITGPSSVTTSSFYSHQQREMEVLPLGTSDSEEIEEYVVDEVDDIYIPQDSENGMVLLIGIYSLDCCDCNLIWNMNKPF